MPYYSTPPVADQPQINLARWRIMQTESGDHHFVGYNIDDQEGRVSTVVLQFDVERRLGITSSGRVYELHGPPGLDPDAGYVWHVWKAVNHVTKAEDITEDVLSGHATVGRAEGDLREYRKH